MYVDATAQKGRPVGVPDIYSDMTSPWQPLVEL